MVLVDIGKMSGCVQVSASARCTAQIDSWIDCNKVVVCFTTEFVLVRSLTGKCCVDSETRHK